VACCVGHRGAAIWSLLGEKRTSRGHRKSVACDPQRHVTTVNFCTAKGLFDHVVGGCEQCRRDRQAESVKSQNTTCRKNDIALNRYAAGKVLAAKFKPDLLESPKDRGRSSPTRPLIASRTDASAERDVDHQASQLSRTGRRDGRGIPYTRAIHTPGRSTWSRDCRCHRAW
jgi:hypothetical protein